MTKGFVWRALPGLFFALSSATLHAQDDLDDLFGPSESSTADEQQTASEAQQVPQASAETAPEQAADAELDTIPVGQDDDIKPVRGSGSRLIEEVIVTAQKREEDVQDVPIMINAFSGEKLDAFGVESTADLQKITPGLTYTYTYGYSLIYIRGVGTDAFLPNADPSVATYIDGINIGPSQGKQDTLGPVERVEVLKGPQGTLFGRNATGGAINIVTADSPDEFIGTAKYSIGNYNSQKYQLSTLR